MVRVSLDFGSAVDIKLSQVSGGLRSKFSFILMSSNAASVPICNLRAADASFNRQIDLVRESLKNFTAIVALNTLGPAKVAMEELVNLTVRRMFLFL